MKRILLSALIALASTICLSGQNKSNKYEIGIGYAPYFLAHVDDGILIPYKSNAYAEWRHGLSNHIDAGARLDYKTFPSSSYDFVSHVSFEGRQHDVAVLAFADYNHMPGKAVNLFFGLGLGPGMMINHWKTSHSYSIKDDDPKTPVVNSEFMVVVCPRVGLELFQRLRLAASVDASMSDTRWPVCFSAGWTF